MDDLKALRKETGAGVMDCRKALDASQGDIPAAKTLIAEWGLNEVEKRSSRETKEGLVALAADSGKAALAALSCETDFVARNPLFIETASSLAQSVLESGSASMTAAAEASVAELGMRMKENVVVSGLAYLSAGHDGLLEYYCHGGGRIAAAVSAKALSLKSGSRVAEADAKAILHEICLQVAAKAPLYIDKDHIPAEALQDAKRRFAEEIADDVKLKDKPPAILEKALSGKLRRYVSESCLLSQAYIKDETMDLGSWLDGEAQRRGMAVVPTGFIRLEIGQDEAKQA